VCDEPLLILPYCYSYVPNCVCSFVGYEYELDVCVSVAILILTALDDRAWATVSASHIEHPTDGEKERDKKLLTEVCIKLAPFTFPLV